jgi:SAM-dependent methyltransferase
VKINFAAEWAAFSGESLPTVRERIGRSGQLITEEWQALIGDVVPDAEQALRFYTESQAYVYEILGSSQFHQDRGLPATLEEWLRRDGLETALDYGCGCGGLGLGLGRGFSVALCDLPNVRFWPFVRHLAARREETEGATICCTVEELRASESQFDCVVALEVLEHVPDPVELIEWLLGMVRPGGLLFGSWSFEPSERAEHLPSTWDRFTFRDMLRAKADLEWIEQCPYWAWVYRKR